MSGWQMFRGLRRERRQQRQVGCRQAELKALLAESRERERLLAALVETIGVHARIGPDIRPGADDVDVVATVSHEFRTPLTSIIGNLDLVLGEELPLPVLRRIEVAQRNAERLLALVSDLLVSAGSAAQVQPRRTDLAALVEASLGSARAQAQSSRVSLAMDVAAPLWAEVDPLRIGQALDNLVSNAIKYSPHGGAVTVSARAEGGRVLLEVEDSGMGMTAADAGRIFTRFFRSPAVRDGSIPGAGLGLSITKAIVEGHGGSISCSTHPGRGSTFTVELPAEGAPRAF